MFGLINSEEKNQNEKIDKLQKRFDHLDKLYEEFLEQYGISLEELEAFCSNPNHFEDGAWKNMEAARKQLDAKLQLDLNHIKNPKKTSQKYRDIQQAQNWLFVK